MHRIWVEQLPDSIGSIIAVSGDEAHHALRVKRLGAGDSVELIDGAGMVGQGRIERSEKLGKHEGWGLDVRLETVRREEPIHPRLEVMTSTPKGPAAEWVVDQLAQVGVAMWRPLVCARTEVDPRAAKVERLRRHAREASKQCGRAWVMEVSEPVALDEALRPEPQTAIVLAHATGGPYHATNFATVRLLIGPVGDFTPDEIEMARRAGASIVGFGPLVMRIETAALAASAVVMDRERR